MSAYLDALVVGVEMRLLDRLFRIEDETIEGITFRFYVLFNRWFFGNKTPRCCGKKMVER